MELIGVLSNPEVCSGLDRLHQAIASLSAPTSHRAVRPPHRRRPGAVLQAIQVVLAEHPEGLRTVEVRRSVVECLGCELPPATVKGTLAAYAEPGGPFERIARGRYRLR